MTSPVVKLDGAKVSACLTCLLCNKWFRNATTISECLHTFCKECIDKKLIDEQLKHCPVCYTDLGCSPLDKLRPDRCLQDLRERIVPVPCAKQNDKAPDNVPLIKLRIKRKKKFLSSLRASSRIAKAASRKVFITKSDFSAPKPDKVKNVKGDENHRGVEVLQEVSRIASARRAKAAARIKFVRTASPPARQLDRVKGEEKEDDHPGVEASNGTLKIRIQNSSISNTSQQIANKISRDNEELRNGKTDMLDPLKCLAVEDTSEYKSLNKSTMQENGVTPVLVHSNNNDPQVDNVEINKHYYKTSDQDESTTSKSDSKSDSVKRQRLLSPREKTLKICEDLNFPAQPESGSNSESNIECSPIWFCLISAEEKRASAQLQQISSCYLRVKDGGSVTVSYIKKYLVKKLGLNSENEVEITLRGQPLLSSLQLKNLVEMWLQTVPTNEIQTSVGSSAKDYIMVLSYGRKA